MSSVHTLIDAGPLVAYLVRDDTHHQWTCQTLKTIPPPLHTCEAVLTEAFHLLGKATSGREGLAALLRGGRIRLAFQLENELERVLSLMAKYADVPMSYADACLVRMSELSDRARLLTLDSDFKVYKRNGRGAIKTISPR